MQVRCVRAQVRERVGSFASAMRTAPPTAAAAGLPEPRPRLPRQRARQLARRDRARGPGLRPDRQPDGDRGPVLRHALRPGAARPAAGRPARAAAGPASRCRCSTRVEAVGLRSSSRCSSTDFALALVLATRDRRRLARLGRPGADPRRGDRGAGARPASCARATRCSTSRFTVGAAGGPAIAGLVVAGAGVETALLADAVSFMAVAGLLVVARRLRLPEPDGAGGALDRAPAPRARLRPRAARAAPPARRPGARVRLLRARDPDRGRVREGDPRRRRRRLRRPARQLGASGWSPAASRSPPCAGSRCGCCSPSRPWRSGSPTWRPAISPTLLARLRRLGRRRARQRSPVDRAGDRGPGAHPRRLPGPGAVAARGARERDAGDRLPARRRDRRDLRAPRELRGRRRRRARGRSRSRRSRSAPRRVGARSSSRAPQDGLQDGASSVAAAGRSRTALTRP